MQSFRLAVVPLTRHHFMKQGLQNSCIIYRIGSGNQTSSIVRLYSNDNNSSRISAHDPAFLNLGSSAGSQAAQAASITAMSNEERSAVANAAATDFATNQRVESMEDSHRHSSNVSLHSAMQSNVPQPYDNINKSPNHMNMPSGGANRQVKFDYAKRFDINEAEQMVNEASGRPQSGEASAAPEALSQKQRMKKAVTEYGGTVIVFHTCLSLTTLGISYLAVSSGVDVVALLSSLGFSQETIDSKLATGTSTLVLAYAAHKVFAPARMAVTLTATPFIVRYLRRVGVLKAPVVSPKISAKPPPKA